MRGDAGREHARVPHQRARDRDALLLPAAQLRAPLADGRGVAELEACSRRSVVKGRSSCQPARRSRGQSRRRSRAQGREARALRRGGARSAAVRFLNIYWTRSRRHRRCRRHEVGRDAVASASRSLVAPRGATEARVAIHCVSHTRGRFARS